MPSSYQGPREVYSNTTRKMIDMTVIICHGDAHSAG